MKTLAEIKEEVYEEYDVQYECDMYESVISEIAKRYATEYAKEALRLASINADTKMQRYNDLQDIIVVDKETILSEYNLPEHR